MSKNRLRIVSIVAVALVVVLLGLFLFPRQSEDRLPSEPAQETATSIDLGVIYLPVTPGLSAYYELGVDSGVLVTEVISDGLADRAGVQVGDVILSYNGIRLEEGTSLLGMMRACPVGSRVMMEVWRGKNLRTVELVHTDMQGGMDMMRR